LQLSINVTAFAGHYYKFEYESHAYNK